MTYTCNRCQDRTVVGGFMPAPCPECRAVVDDERDQLRAELIRTENDYWANYDQLRAELARVVPVFDAAVAFHEALKDENNCCVDEHNTLFAAVDAARKASGG